MMPFSATNASAFPLPLRERVLSRVRGEAGEGLSCISIIGTPHPARSYLLATLSRKGRGKEKSHAAH
jgi:hypothetical protein